jgi:hypothetical protein
MGFFGVSYLTHEILCSRCGCTLYRGFNIRPSSEILAPMGNKCRKCGAMLRTDNFKVEVYRADELPYQAAASIVD